MSVSDKNYVRFSIFSLIAISFVAFYLWKEYQLNNEFGFLLDDSWIHLQFAKNIGTGKGFSYNSGIPVAGSTAPLWTFILSIPFFFSANPVLFSKLFGIIFYLISIFYFMKICDYFMEKRTEAFFVTMIFAFEPIFTWGSISGMEVMLFTAFMLSAIFYHLSTRNTNGPKKFLPTLLLGLSGFARPECFLLAPIFFLDDLILFFYKKDNNLKVFLKDNLLKSAIWLAFVLLFLIFNYQFDGRIFPNTFYAKSGNMFSTSSTTLSQSLMFQTRILFGIKKVFRSFWFWFYNTNILFFVAFFPGLCAYMYDNIRKSKFHADKTGETDKRTFLFPLLIFLYPFLMGSTSMTSAYDILGRYITHLTALFTFISAYGIVSIGRVTPNRYIRITLFLVFSLALFIESTAYSSVIYAERVQNTQEIHVKVARWVNENTDGKDLIALHDVGAIKYFTDRKIIDIWGLVTNEALSYRKKYPHPQGTLKYILKEKPDYLIVYPAWFSIVQKFPGIFLPVFEAPLPDNSAGGWHTMVVYKCRWNDLTPLYRYLN